MAKGSIGIEGLDEVLKGLEKASVEVRKTAMEGMKAGGLEIIAEAQKNLRDNGNVVNGHLRASGKVQQIDELTLDIGFFDTQSNGENGGYAYYVEYGRRAGKMPPPRLLEDWVHRKWSLSREGSVGAAFALALQIAKKGTKPHPYFNPAVDKHKGKIISEVKKALGL